MADTPEQPAPTPTVSPADRAERAARDVWRTLSERRGLRVTLIGIGLVLLSFWLGTGSALSLPLLVIGVIMILTGSMGPRLRGRIAVDFGPHGTGLEVNCHVAPPGHRAIAPDASDAGRAKIALVPNPRSSGDERPARPDDVIEGHGETIEIDVEQLRAALRTADAPAAG